MYEVKEKRKKKIFNQNLNHNDSAALGNFTVNTPVIFQIRKLRLIKSDYLPKSTVNKSGPLDFSLALFPHPGIIEKTLRGKNQEGKKKNQDISSQIPRSMIG